MDNCHDIYAPGFGPGTECYYLGRPNEGRQLQDDERRLFHTLLEHYRGGSISKEWLESELRRHQNFLDGLTVE